MREKTGEKKRGVQKNHQKIKEISDLQKISDLKKNLRPHKYLRSQKISDLKNT